MHDFTKYTRMTQIIIQNNAPSYHHCSFTNYYYARQDIEDVTPVETPDDLFCRITKEAYEKGKAQQVENELLSACVSAPKLVKAIRTNEALGYLDTKDLPATDLYNLLDEHYHLPFKPRAFQNARSK